VRQKEPALYYTLYPTYPAESSGAVDLQDNLPAGPAWDFFICIIGMLWYNDVLDARDVCGKMVSRMPGRRDEV
jgi:hypothetical protein